MKIDLHIHSRDCSDGRMSLPEIFEEAKKRGIGLISITDHDAIQCQESAFLLAADFGLYYISGVELNISFSHPRYRGGKPISLDVLGYNYDIHNHALLEKTRQMREHRTTRARSILEKINQERAKAHLSPMTTDHFKAIEDSVDGAIGRPHIADYMVRQGMVSTRQEAFDKYLVKCNVPKLPVSLEEASELVRAAGGKLILAHPGDPNGTSLFSFTDDVPAQLEIIEETMLPHLDGVECFHSRLDKRTTTLYLAFARQKGLMVTGGSDCHQQPVIMGTVDVPAFVGRQFNVGVENEQSHS
jgi:predicted metal-dependent phosphoesterase TrpH